MVKEFETGSGVFLNFLVQRTKGTEVGNDTSSTLEAMCGHALYIVEQYLKGGAGVCFPVHEDPLATTSHPEARVREVREVLTDLHADHDESLCDDLNAVRRHLSTGTTVIVMVGVQDAKLPETILSIPDVHFVCLVYDLDDYRKLRPGAQGAANAADPTYLARLEAAGAEVSVMPRVERVS
jgi:hypothetical protein